MPNQKRATSSTSEDCTSPTSTGGSALPTMISSGDIGVTSNWSKVPCSRSRATDSAVKSSVCTMLSAAIMPGSRFQRVSRLGLNQARDSTASGAGARPARLRSSAL